MITFDSENELVPFVLDKILLNKQTEAYHFLVANKKKFLAAIIECAKCYEEFKTQCLQNSDFMEYLNHLLKHYPTHLTFLLSTDLPYEQKDELAEKLINNSENRPFNISSLDFITNIFYSIKNKNELQYQTFSSFKK